MKLFIDEENRIIEVGTTSNPSLREIEVEDDETNPFKDWDVATICCYQITLSADGRITEITPYVPYSLVQHIRQLGQLNKELQERANEVDTTIEDLMTNVIPELLGLTE